MDDASTPQELPEADLALDAADTVPGVRAGGMDLAPGRDGHPDDASAPPDTFVPL